MCRRCTAASDVPFEEAILGGVASAGFLEIKEPFSTSKTDFPVYNRKRDHGQENPRNNYVNRFDTETHEFRSRQLRDEAKSCGTQPAYIRVIHRRYMMIPLLIIDWRMPIKTPTKQGAVGYFFLLTSVNHISC